MKIPRNILHGAFALLCVFATQSAFADDTRKLVFDGVLSEHRLTLKELAADFPADWTAYDVAMVFARKALDLSPRHLPTRLLLAQVYDRGLHEVEAAIRAYKKVISLAGYESDNPYCAAAREALDHLVHRAARIPVEVV